MEPNKYEPHLFSLHIINIEKMSTSKTYSIILIGEAGSHISFVVFFRPISRFYNLLKFTSINFLDFCGMANIHCIEIQMQTKKGEYQP